MRGNDVTLILGDQDTAQGLSQWTEAHQSKASAATVLLLAQFS